MTFSLFCASELMINFPTGYLNIELTFHGHDAMSYPSWKAGMYSG
jgi:hypothetical protein